jgi:TolB-like protein
VYVSLLFWSPFQAALPGARDLDTGQFLDSVAVLPLANATDMQQLDAVGVGLVQAILAQLKRIEQLKTIDGYSARAAAERGLPPTDLARLLGVQHIVLPQLDMTDNGPVINLRQTDIATGADIVIGSWPVSAGEPDAATDTIAWEATKRVVESMPRLPVPQEFYEIRRGPGEEHYRFGKYWLGRRTPEGFRLAIENFIEAIVLDDGNAQAWSDLSSAYALALTYRYDIGLDAYAAAARALTHANRALQRDPNGVSGYASRGYIEALINADTSRVMADFSQAINLLQNDASAASWSARAFAMDGQTEKALNEAEAAAALDPMGAGRQIAVAYLSLQLGHYDRAIEAAVVAQNLEPELMLSRAIQARALLLNGQAEACAELDLGPHEALHATCLWESGQTAEAERIIGEVERLTLDNQSVHPDFTPVLQAEDLAVHHAWTGNPDETLRWIEKAYDMSPTGLEVRVWESALFDRVRDQLEDDVNALRAGLYEKVFRTTL